MTFSNQLNAGLEKSIMLCLETGFPSLVLPVESSCKPTSKASLSVSDRDVVKQLRYWGDSFYSGHDQNFAKMQIENWL